LKIRVKQTDFLYDWQDLFLFIAVIVISGIYTFWVVATRWKINPRRSAIRARRQSYRSGVASCRSDRPHARPAHGSRRRIDGLYGATNLVRAGSHPICRRPGLHREQSGAGRANGTNRCDWGATVLGPAAPHFAVVVFAWPGSRRLD